MAKRLPEPRNAEGGSPRVTGTPVPGSKINQSIPPGQGYFSPFIPTAGDTAGDTAYFLINSIFDPRTLQSTDGTARYSSVSLGQDYRSIWQDILYQIIFAQFRMRQEPNQTTLNEMLEIICDLTRCLGIYLTALSLSASRDPDMFARSRVLGLYDSKMEMQSQLAILPLPRYLVELSLKYVGLVDVSGSFNFQNIGFLYSGDYSAFNTLMSNIRSKSFALNWLRQIYPEIGLIGDPDGSRNVPDILQAFINANVKDASSDFAPYVVVEQATDEAIRLASGGLLHTVSRGGAGAHTITGWALPGSGIGTNPAVRTWVPSMCVWKAATGKDAAITRTVASQAYNISAGVIETLQNAPLAVNLVHEYNMNSSDTQPAVNPYTFNGSSGATSFDPLAAETTRYRVSAGFGLGSITYGLQANVVSTFRDILFP